MRLNGHYIPYVKRWNFKATGSHKRSVVENYIFPKSDEAGSSQGSQIQFKIYDRETAIALEEMFDNPAYTLAVIEDFYIDQYNGVYYLQKGDISQDAGKVQWIGKVKLGYKSNTIRYSQYKKDFDNDFETLQTETSTFASLINGSAKVGTWATVGSGFGVTVDSGKNKYTIGYEWWNSVEIEADITLGNTGEYIGLIINHVDGSNWYNLRIFNNASLRFTKQLYTTFTDL